MTAMMMTIKIMRKSEQENYADIDNDNDNDDDEYDDSKDDEKGVSRRVTSTIMMM